MPSACLFAGRIHLILFMNGAPEEIRTPDPQIRSLVLYPAELRARVADMGRRCPSRGGIANGSGADWQDRF